MVLVYKPPLTYIYPSSLPLDLSTIAMQSHVVAHPALAGRSAKALYSSKIGEAFPYNSRLETHGRDFFPYLICNAPNTNRLPWSVRAI